MNDNVYIPRLDAAAENILSKVDSGIFMPTFSEWLPEVSPEFTWDWKHLVHLQEKLQRVADGELKRLMIWMPPRHGKEILHETQVLTTKGWSTHGDLRVDDFVFSPSGKKRKVIALSPEVKSNMEVELFNGDKIICHANHEWTVYDRSKSKWITVETNYFTENTRYGKQRTILNGERAKYQLPNIKPLELNESHQTIEPYYFGVWLGDGESKNSRICGVEADLAEIERGIGYEVRNYYIHKTTGVHYHSHTHQGLVTEFKKIGVYNNKHIPNLYKMSSIEQRKLLMAGLIDSDGSVDDKGRVRIVTVSKQLADDIHEVLTTLGQRPYITVQPPNTKTGFGGTRDTYSIGFQPTISFPTQVTRKKIDKLIDQRRIGIKSVKRIENGGMGRCIQIDHEDGLYLVGKNLIPTHNSEMTTIRFPAWWLERDPTQRVMICAYNATLANKFSRKIRNLARERIAINSERRAVDEWETDAGGGCRAAGVGGGIAGMGGNLIIIDDPVKSKKEAASITFRNATYEWYTHDLMTRAEPDAAIIVIQTRWHEDDLSGRILENEPDVWEVVNLPAIAEFDNDPIGRMKGDALCPERFDEEQLERIRKILGRGFASLYQQRPVEQEGGFFKRSWFKQIDRLPEHPEHGLKKFKFVRFWDKAATTGGDYTAGVLMAYDRESGVYFVIDVVREKLSTHERDNLMLKTAYRDRERFGNVYIRHEKEPGSSGIDAAKATTSMLAGFAVKSIRATGSKSLRAEPFQAQVEGGNVRVLSGKHVPDFIEELCSFPSGKHDDMVDAASGAFTALAGNNAFIMTPKSGLDSLNRGSFNNHNDVKFTMIKTAVFTYGRFQPPHIGHINLLKAMQDVEGDKLLFSSMSQHTTENPLSYAAKYPLLKNAFGEYVTVVPNLGKIIEIMKYLETKYSRVHMFIGEDRFHNFKKLLYSGNGKYFTFKSVDITSVPRSNGVSATQLRQLAKARKKDEFVKFIPNELGEKVYNLLT